MQLKNYIKIIFMNITKCWPEHYIAGENYEKAADYSKLAAKKAEKTASLNDAIAYAKKRVVSIEKLNQTDDKEKTLIDARTILGLYTAQLNSFAEAKKAIDPIVDLAINHDYRRRLCQIYTIIGAYYAYVEDDHLESTKHLERALKLSEEVNDIVSFVLSNYWIGVALCFNCEFRKGYSHINKALKINEAANNLWGIASMKSTIGGLCYWNGKIDFAHQASSQAVQMALDSGDIYPKALAYSAKGTSYYGKGCLDKAIPDLNRGADFCGRINTPVWYSLVEFGLGDVYFDMGKYPESQNHFDKAAAISEQNRLMPSFMNLCKTGSAKAKIMKDEKDVNLELFYDYYDKNRYRLWDGWMARYIGDILLNIDDRHMSEAEVWIKKAYRRRQQKQYALALGQGLCSLCRTIQ